MLPVIRVKNLKKIYRVGTEKVRALNGINLDIQAGEICCIVGSSGSGKSTLLNQLAGLEKPTKGDVYIKSKCISKMTEKELAVFRQQHLGFVFQSYNLMPTQSAKENVAMPLMFKGVPKRKREKLAMQQLKAVGLGNRSKHKPTEMSGGQQQRVGIARAFVAKPAVIFADEPTGNLDTKTTKDVLAGMLTMARNEGITLVMVTHERELASCSDRIITLSDGKIISDERTDGSEIAKLLEYYEQLQQQRKLEAKTKKQLAKQKILDKANKPNKVKENTTKKAVTPSIFNKILKKKVTK